MFLDLTPEFTEDLNDRDWVMQSWRWMSDRAGRPWEQAVAPLAGCGALSCVCFLVDCGILLLR